MARPQHATKGNDVFVLGIDSSTQSTKALVVDTADGRVVSEARSSHPEGSEVAPEAWWADCDAAVHHAVEHAPGPVESVAVASQQHGMIALDAAGEPVRDALLWNDTRSAPQARELVQRHGAGALARRTGLVPVASITLTKLAWLAEYEPQHADRVDRVLLPHDWLTWRLAGGGEQAHTDRGDASGTGYFSPETGEWLPDLLRDAMRGRTPRLPGVLGPAEAAGSVADFPGLSGASLGAGTGDNMAGALALDIAEGDVVVSVGTSGTVFAVSDRSRPDECCAVAGFCDATGRYLPLVCTLNAARVLDATAHLLGTDLDGLSRLALAARPGAEGLTLLPYLDGERTPDLPDTAGTLTGMRASNVTPENLARSAVEGMLCGLADGIDALRDVGVEPRRVLLIGGASDSPAVRAVAPSLFGVSVEIPEPAEYVALGAARQAAWAASGNSVPPTWRLRSTAYEVPEDDQGQEVRDIYRRARQHIYGV